MFSSLQITKAKVDSFKLGQRLPSCQLQVKWSGEGRPPDFMLMVKLQGAKKPSNFFHITLHCESPSEGTCLPHNWLLFIVVLLTINLTHVDLVSTDVSPPVQRSSRKRGREHTSEEGDSEKGGEEGLREGVESDAGPSMPKRPRQSREKGEACSLY